MVHIRRTLLGRRPLQRSVLLFGLLLGLPYAVAYIGLFPVVDELDFHAYYFTGLAVLEGEPFVGWAVADGSFLTAKAYVYAPVTALVFTGYALFPNWETAYVAHVGMLALSLLAVGVVTIRFIESHGVDLDPVDRWLIVGFCTFSIPAVMRLSQANVDPLMLLLLAVGLLAVERGQHGLGGALWGVVALFKLFPAFLGVWLIYRRAYRAIAAACAVGIGGLLVGVAIFGVDANVAFFEFALTERSRHGEFVGGLDATKLYITLKRPLSHLVPLGGLQLTLLATWLLAPLVALVYLAADSELDRTVAYFATLVALLITVVPSTLGYVVYLLFPLVALLYLVEQRAALAAFTAGLVLINVPLYPHFIEGGLAAASVPSVVSTPVVAAAYAVLTYGSVALWGMLAVLLGCLLYTVGPRVASVVAAERRDLTAFRYLARGLATLKARPLVGLPFVGVLAVAVAWELYDGLLVDTLLAAGLFGPDPAGAGAAVLSREPTTVAIILIGIGLGLMLALATLVAMATAYLVVGGPGQSADVGSLVRRSSSRIPAYLAAAVITVLVLPLGLALFVLPGIYLVVGFALAGPAIILDGHGPIRGLAVGLGTVREHPRGSFVVTFVTAGLTVGLLWIPFIGPAAAVVLGLPVLALAITHLYLDTRPADRNSPPTAFGTA